MDVRVIYRTCPTCGTSFGQPDDPGRKRTRQRARRRTLAAAPARSRLAGLVTAAAAPRRPMPAAAAPARSAARVAATGGRTPSTTTKAASTGFPEEADACRAKAEQLRSKYGL
jgi:hypothetical protein